MLKKFILVYLFIFCMGCSVFAFDGVEVLNSRVLELSAGKMITEIAYFHTNVKLKKFAVLVRNIKSIETEQSFPLSVYITTNRIIEGKIGASPVYLRVRLNTESDEDGKALYEALIRIFAYN